MNSQETFIRVRGGALVYKPILTKSQIYNAKLLRGIGYAMIPLAGLNLILIGINGPQAGSMLYGTLMSLFGVGAGLWMYWWADSIIKKGTP